MRGWRRYFPLKFGATLRHTSCNLMPGLRREGKRQEPFNEIPYSFSGLLVSKRERAGHFYFLLKELTMLKNRSESWRYLFCWGCIDRIRAVFAIVFAVWIFIFSSDSAFAGREKKAFAHHMGSLNAGRGAMTWHTHYPELGDPAHSNGGDYRSLPLVPYDFPEMTLDEAAEYQISQALRIGLDGFAVNDLTGGDDAKEV